MNRKERCMISFENDYAEGAHEAILRRLAEIVEIPGLKWYIGTQFHPEYQSTVLKPHPLFLDFIKTAINNK